MAENAVVTYTTSDGSGTKEMRLAVGTDQEPKTKGPWSAALKSRLGLKGNYEPVEWVAFIATTDHNWGPNDQFTGTVTVRFTTGSENLKTNLAYFIGNTQDGVHDDAQYYLLHDSRSRPPAAATPPSTTRCPRCAPFRPRLSRGRISWRSNTTRRSRSTAWIHP